MQKQAHLDFDGADYMETPLVMSGAGTIVLVIDPDSINQEAVIGAFDDSGPPPEERLYAGVGNDVIALGLADDDFSTLSGATSVPTTNTPSILMYTYDVTVSSVNLYYNGSLEFSGSSSGTGIPTLPAFIGAANTTSGAVFNYDGALSQVLFYDRSLSASELNKIGQYFETAYEYTWTTVV
jgi:hypothetical protein